MTKTRAKAIRQKAISELERLSLSLDAELEITANMTVAEIDAELCEMGVDPYQLSPLNLCQMLSKNEAKSPAYAYVSDELLRDEPITDEVRLLILRLRHLSRQQRYEEALELAERATLLAPDYWRALISYGGLLVLLGHVELTTKTRKTRKNMKEEVMKLQTALKSLLLIGVVLAAALVSYIGNLATRRGTDSVTELAQSGIQLGGTT